MRCWACSQRISLRDLSRRRDRRDSRRTTMGRTAAKRDPKALIHEVFTREAAHMSLDEAVADFPSGEMNTKAPHLSYSFWHILEHIRIGKWDLLEYVQTSPTRHSGALEVARSTTHGSRLVTSGSRAAPRRRPSTSATAYPASPGWTAPRSSKSSALRPSSFPHGGHAWPARAISSWSAARDRPDHARGRP